MCLFKYSTNGQAAVASDRYQGFRRGVVIGEAAVSKNYLGTDYLWSACLNRRLLAGSFKVASGKVDCDVCRGFSYGLPTGTSAQVCGQRVVHRFSAT